MSYGAKDLPSGSHSSGGHCRMKLKLLLVFSVLMLFACDMQLKPKELAEEKISMNPALEAEGQSPARPVNDEMTSLRSAITTLAAPNGAAWDTFDKVSGLSWRDPQPVASNEGYQRTGNILLVGFAVVRVPNGKVGVDADSIEDNEGNSGITLSGNVTEVHSLAVMKFYPSENYKDIIKQQLLAEDQLTLVADQCASGGAESDGISQKNMFYQIKLSTNQTLFLEAFVDEEGSKYSPGTTTFIFYRDKPIKRIAEMQCRESK